MVYCDENLLIHAASDRDHRLKSQTFYFSLKVIKSPTHESMKVHRYQYQVMLYMVKMETHLYRGRQRKKKDGCRPTYNPKRHENEAKQYIFNAVQLNT